MNRMGWISIAGVLTVVLAIWPDSSTNIDVSSTKANRRAGADRQSGQPSSIQAASHGNAESVENLRLENLVRENAKEDKSNPFASTSWYRPPAPKVLPPTPPPAPAEPAIPSAPPLPFSYMGSYEDGNKRLVLLVKGSQMYTVGEEDVLDNLYRVENIEGSKIELVYLPLGTKQTIDTGEKAFSARKQGK